MSFNGSPRLKPEKPGNENSTLKTVYGFDVLGNRIPIDSYWGSPITRKTVIPQQVLLLTEASNTSINDLALSLLSLLFNILSIVIVIGTWFVMF